MQIVEEYAKRINGASSDKEVLKLWGEFGKNFTTEEVIELYKRVSEVVFNAAIRTPEENFNLNLD
tara:strand:- start:433 stop:627 length:195 start_codon:yes stop_codon:yes gene_type:complete